MILLIFLVLGVQTSFEIQNNEKQLHSADVTYYFA